MMSTIKIVLFTCISIFLYGCFALHQGQYNSSTAISSANFKIIGQVKGMGRVYYFLGIGGLGNNGLLSQARNNIFENYSLPQGVCLANETVDYKTVFFFLYFEKTAIITADVVDFNVPSSLKMSDLIKPKSKFTINSFVIGDSVSFSYKNVIRKGRVTNINPSFNSIDVIFKSLTGQEKTIKLDIKRILNK